MAKLFDDYSAAVTADWDTDIIAKPKVIDGQIQKWTDSYPHVIFYTKQSTLPLATASTSAYERTYNAELVLRADTFANLEKLIEAHLKLFYDNAKMWVSPEIYDEEQRYGYHSCKMLFTEQEVIQTTSW